MNGTLAMRGILVADSTYNTMVAGRIYYAEADQASPLPFSIITGDSVDGKDTKDGASTLDFDMIWLTHFASTYKEVSDMAAAARLALERKSGTYNTKQVVSIQFRDERDGSEFLVNKKTLTKEQLYQVMVTN